MKKQPGITRPDNLTPVQSSIFDGMNNLHTHIRDSARSYGLTEEDADETADQVIMRMIRGYLLIAERGHDLIKDGYITHDEIDLKR